jgi:serine/threonine protein kinase HipA of HipAB toxin-antitoxin module
LQALGPINDDRSVPWTMFNDDVQMGFFDIYDQYLLNILYDSRVRPGMTRAEVKALLPDVMPDVRQRVSRTQIQMAPN